jgi:hypothetical protein
MRKYSPAVAAAALLLSWATPTEGANRYFFGDRTVAAGAAGEAFPVRADNDIALLGFSFGVHFDPTALRVTSVTIAGTDAAAADYFDGRIDGIRGLAGYGCVLDTGAPIDKKILPGTNRTIARLVADVVGAAGTSSQLVFQTVSVSSDPLRLVKNVMTTDGGFTVVPSLVPGTVTIQDRTPRIVSFSNNDGLPGQVFQVQGDFFGEPGLQVRVCSAVAAATLRGDGVTLDVTAPGCGVEGAVEVEVCTVRGCDSDPAGFTYLPAEIDFLRGDANYDGDVDISDGIRILLYIFVGGIETDCPDAFDANDLNGVTVTDAISIFQFLFTDGARIPEPFPVPGPDPTADSLDRCTGRP